MGDPLKIAYASLGCDEDLSLDVDAMLSVWMSLQLDVVLRLPLARSVSPLGLGRASTTDELA